MLASSGGRSALFGFLAGFCVGMGCATSDQVLEKKRREEEMAGGDSFCTPAASEECYSGPREKAGRGACKRGQRVCDEDGHLMGLVRGQTIFEARAMELSAHPGTVVGVNEEERLSTPMPRSLWMRHPWLQFNLLTAFIAAAVVGVFQ